MTAATTKKRTAPARKTSTKKPTTTAKTSKPSTRQPVTPKVVAIAPEPTVVETSQPVVSEPDLRKRELIDLVVERSGIKKKDAKPVVEAMLEVLGETLAEGRELNLQPLGKLRINRVQERGNGRVMICRVRQSLSGAEKQDEDPLADGED
jgi:DNA-binding protein HU-alpha